MRASTINEIAAVSGGEAPCITLQTQCVGTPPTTGQINKAASTAALLLAGAALKTKTRERHWRWALPPWHARRSPRLRVGLSDGQGLGSPSVALLPVTAPIGRPCVSCGD
jgi:hypothetical protein